MKDLWAAAALSQHHTPRRSHNGVMTDVSSR